MPPRCPLILLIYGMNNNICLPTSKLYFKAKKRRFVVLKSYILHCYKGLLSLHPTGRVIFKIPRSREILCCLISLNPAGEPLQLELHKPHFKCSFICFETQGKRERERESEQGSGRERGRERIPSRLHAVVQSLAQGSMSVTVRS